MNRFTTLSTVCADATSGNSAEIHGGVDVGDRILAVDGENVEGRTLTEVRSSA